MITAEEARKGTKTERNQAYLEFVAEIEKRIKYAMEHGQKSCCFGNWDRDMWDYERQAKEEFMRRGFKFFNDGICGGVLQHTQSISW